MWVSDRCVPQSVRFFKLFVFFIFWRAATQQGREENQNYVQNYNKTADYFRHFRGNSGLRTHVRIFLKFKPMNLTAVHGLNTKNSSHVKRTYTINTQSGFHVCIYMSPLYPDLIPPTPTDACKRYCFFLSAPCWPCIRSCGTYVYFSFSNIMCAHTVERKVWSLESVFCDEHVYLIPQAQAHILLIKT